MAALVKLCAIAKDEGPYLADWVFHHLHFGFDAIEVWVNDTQDASRRILRRIGRRYPQVSVRQVDRLLAECLAAHQHFQQTAYARLARKARRAGYSHVAFLDIDEYWTPQDCVSSVHGFLPDDPLVNVVSFPWCGDVPDPTRQPFTPPLLGAIHLQMDRHVKSVVRLDGSVRMFREHTARTRGGVRLLVRDPFPLVDRKAQRSGAFVTQEHLVEHWETLPEAFVLHAMNRSQTEYVANLTKGLRQTGFDLPWKTNRPGYVPSDAPVVAFVPPARALRSYRRKRARFHRECDVAVQVRRSEELLLARAGGVLESLRTDETLREQLSEPLRGLTVV